MSTVTASSTTSKRGARPARRVLPRHDPRSGPSAPGQWPNSEGKHIRVAPEDIRKVALFTIEGELDDISGSGQTQAAHTLCANIPAAHQLHLTAEGAGHYGIFSGRRWREMICRPTRVA
jgi:polyhydroxyalkanoate depolymerase